MYDSIAIVLEIFTIIIISNHLYVNKIISSKYVLIMLFSTLYAIVNQYISIPVIEHYLIFTLLVLILHKKEKKWVAPFASIVAYAMLIYLQVICLRWLSPEWLAQNYELGGLCINIIVFTFVGILHFIFKWRQIDVQYNHLRGWQRVMTACVAVAVVLFCYVYKPILEERYFIDSYSWMCFTGGVLLAVLLIERQSERIKNKQIIQELKEQIDIEYGYRHDFEKQLRLLDKEGHPLAQELIEENERQISMDRLPQYPRMVIESYLNEFMKRGIRVRYDIKEPIPTWRLGLKDTMSVLGNLIENSIEAVEDVPSHKKWIEIAFTNNSDSLQLCISNPFDQKEPVGGAVTKKGISTKGTDRGYGLYIVEKKVKMYHGEFRVYVNDNIFMAVIDI